MTTRCLYCYQTLEEGNVDFHPRCSTKIFGQATSPSFGFDEQDMEALARQFINQGATVTGVQAKLRKVVNDLPSWVYGAIIY